MASSKFLHSRNFTNRFADGPTEVCFPLKATHSIHISPECQMFREDFKVDMYMVIIHHHHHHHPHRASVSFTSFAVESVSFCIVSCYSAHETIKWPN